MTTRIITPKEISNRIKYSKKSCYKDERFVMNLFSDLQTEISLGGDFKIFLDFLDRVKKDSDEKIQKKIFFEIQQVKPVCVRRTLKTYMKEGIFIV